jgi:hypothetical protein
MNPQDAEELKAQYVDPTVREHAVLSNKDSSVNSMIAAERVKQARQRCIKAIDGGFPHSLGFLGAELKTAERRLEDCLVMEESNNNYYGGNFTFVK